MSKVAISLGWRCETAQIGVNLGLREIKSNGYLTCPFDLHNSNYIGVCKCIEDDFKYLTDPKYIKLVNGTFCSEHFEMHNRPLLENQIVNTYYGFIYNHESPGHGNLYINESWGGGINHFVDNNFKNFIDRYNDRVNNFRNYLKNSDKVIFLLMRYNSIPYELCDIISKKYPHLDFELHSFINYTPYTYSMTRGKDDNSVHQWEMNQLEVMNIDRDKYPEEYLRYNQPLIDVNIELLDKRIKLHKI